MKKTHEIFATLFCLLVFCASSITTWQFMLFLSSSNKTTSDKDASKQNSWINLWVDVVLIIIFVMQHSYLNNCSHCQLFIQYPTKSPLCQMCLHTSYICSSSGTPVNQTKNEMNLTLCMQAMIMFWTPVFSIKLWEMNIENIFVWLLHTLTQIIAWGVIYGGTLLMDLPELIGIKQDSNIHFLKLIHTYIML